MEILEDKKIKLKNKKKDVIVADLSEAIAGKKQENKGENKNEIKNEETSENKIKNENCEKKVKFPENFVEYSDGPNNSSPQIDKIEINESNSNTINKIIFNIQILLSMTNKVDDKLLNVFSLLLSQDHLKMIVEERDCREICVNLLCGAKINKNNKKLHYDPQAKSFTKDDLLGLFCDVKCFQKFKDLSYITSKFDYFRLLNIETIYLLSILPEFYPYNLYLESISEISKTLLKNLENSEKLEKLLKNYREKYEKYFIEDEAELEGKIEKLDINEGEIAVNTMFNI